MINLQQLTNHLYEDTNFKFKPFGANSSNGLLRSVIFILQGKSKSDGATTVYTRQSLLAAMGAHPRRGALRF
jgi:hypothetical protein